MHAEHAIGRFQHGGLSRACRVMATVRRTGTPCMSKFTLETGSIAIGDPVMGLARYSVSLPPGRYELEAGCMALVRPSWALVKWVHVPCVRQEPLGDQYTK